MLNRQEPAEGVGEPGDEVAESVEAVRPFAADVLEQLLVREEEVEGDLPLQVLLQQREVGRTDSPQLGVTLFVTVRLRG